MSQFSDKIKEITIVQLAIILMLGLVIESILPDFAEGFGWALVFIAYVIYLMKNSLNSIVYDFTHLGIYYKTIILLFVSNFILAIGIGYFSDYLLTCYPFLDYLPVNEDFPDAAFSLEYILSFILTVIIAPIFEELVFRGVILNRLNRRIPLSFAILISSLLFGVLHGFSGSISAFVFGVSMCFVFLKTDNIFSSFWIHLLNNFTAMILMIIPNIDLMLEGEIISWIFIVLSIVSLIWVFRFIKTSWSEVKNYQ